MTILDWIICALVLFSVITAAIQGFFSEALTTAGLVVGYIVAAWQYRRLAEWFENFLKNPWLAEILGFLIIFFAILLLHESLNLLQGIGGLLAMLGGIVVSLNQEPAPPVLSALATVPASEEEKQTPLTG